MTTIEKDAMEDELVRLTGPGSALHRHLSDRRVWFAAARAGFIQPFHPVIADGVLQHSRTITGLDDGSGRIVGDPVQRIARTADYIERLLRGPNPEDTAREIREIHRDMDGVGADGARYHAYNHEVWALVHLTFAESLLYGARLFHSPIPPEEIEEMYAGLRVVGRMLGVLDKDMPGDVAALDAWLEEQIDAGLYDQRVIEAERGWMRHLPQPKSVPLPRPLWLMARPALGALAVHLFNVSGGLYPAKLRKRAGLRWTPVHFAEYNALINLLRLSSLGPWSFPALPDSA